MSERVLYVQTRYVPELGVTLDGVWFPLELLGRLAEQEAGASDFGYPAFIEASREQEEVLVRWGLAVRETRGGLRSGGKRLDELLNGLEYPDGR